MKLLRTFVRGRRRAIRPARERLAQGTYIELVQSLFGFTVPAMIMTLCFAGTGAFITSRTDDPLLLLFYGLGLIASAARLLTLFGYRRRALEPSLGLHVARHIESRFGTAYIAFAVALLQKS